MGARALQLSLGAPPFIPIPKTARISLDISMEELNQRVIPITIRGFFQTEITRIFLLIILKNESMVDKT